MPEPASWKDRFGGGGSSPHPDDKKDTARKMHFSIWYFILVLMLLSWLHETLLFSQNVLSLPYSDFKSYVRQGNVESVIIGEDTIKGKFLKPVNEKMYFRTVAVNDPGLVAFLEKHNVRYTAEKQNKLLMTILSWIVPLALFALFWGYILRRMGAGPHGVLSLGKARAKIYAEKDVGVTFDDVAGIDEAKRELQEIVEYLRNPEKFKRLGAKIPKGVLLVGPPGTGKTLLARAVAGEAGVPFFSMSGSDFVEMFVGVGAARVRDLFAQAKQNAPCIIFIDELDALGKARGINPMAGHDEREQTLNQLLVEMDGFDSTTGVIIMAATNRPEILDPALLRPGRFDRHIAVDKPDIKGREEILRIHVRNVKLGPDVDLRKIAALTPGFVGADLANLVNEAALLAARRNAEYVEMKDFQEALDRIIGGLEKKNRAINPREKKIVAYHEAGHALVAMSVEHADPVNKISIIPRGIGVLGFTQQLPTEDRYLMTKQELLDRLCVLLGGRVAEEVVFGDVSTGAQNDLQRATLIARSMITEYGMSERLGPITFRSEPKAMFLHTDTAAGWALSREFSEKTAEAIDEETREIVESAHRRVRNILEKNRAWLDRLAEELLEKEVLEGEDLERFVTEFKKHRSGDQNEGGE
ncbi:ATP-dependent zinc metalloprotease FtsH [Thermodesulforhabdus norvegica]|uniref:ATP-dependent zinc metalloprotease FtsH n=1 Tax=Thermodesulforhabdus norvegica TaxID=39841 RepID=A0A1I4VG63_9BACT|nr:ATP-dependent zinc metalloprotease FtsH [Thermodesulforhabdus norvegica]SFN00141.1 membrane protease FtsH catalytic subunit [Thermodesulforhabdus norvegica]